jgi:hypothetical protein
MEACAPASTVELDARQDKVRDRASTADDQLLPVMPTNNLLDFVMTDGLFIKQGLGDCKYHLVMAS